MNDKYLAQYGAMAVKAGVNIQKGQTLIINAPITARDLVHHCARAAYDAGAKEVVVHWADEKLSRIKMERTEKDVLCDVKPWIQDSYLQYIRSEGSAAILSITGSDPELYKGIDAEKVNAYSIARMKALAEYRDYTMASRIQWCVIAVPTAGWAKKVFPGLEAEEAMEKLWETIFKVSRVEGDAVENWKNYAARRAGRRDRINAMRLKTLHFTASNGTDLYVDLADDHIWGGVSEYSEAGVEFIPNMPTEELFTAPHKDRVNGVVYGTKPYVYNGDLIDDFVLTFKDGKVVDFDAKTGRELLAQLLNTDEGACRIGEVALVPASSPITKENILFYNTLFDENAACHIAFGQGYPGTVKGGENMTGEQLLAKGVNDSVIHEDVMIGAADMHITGLCENGETVVLFENGEWVF
ncbi:MAG: aminopeptidase [Oscillospiraceae bacterium]|nr:aminopeptidase [Oscillospiraceae bacterium]